MQNGNKICFAYLSWRWNVFKCKMLKYIGDFLEYFRFLNSSAFINQVSMQQDEMNQIDYHLGWVEVIARRVTGVLNEMLIKKKAEKKNF